MHALLNTNSSDTNKTSFNPKALLPYLSRIAVRGASCCGLDGHACECGAASTMLSCAITGTGGRLHSASPLPPPSPHDVQISPVVP
eukprot:711787-Rhodomonas_salina.3